MIVVLDNIRSIHNVGSIFRTADAVGIEKIYLCGITPGPVDRFGRPISAFTKVSLGAEDSVMWESCELTPDLLERLKSEGYYVAALEIDARSVSYASFARQRPLDKLALVLGGEVLGLSDELLSKADVILEVPMRGKKESLNVAVAFGVVAFAMIQP